MTIKISFRTILTLLTAVLVGYVVYQNWPDIVEATRHLSETNIFVLLLLVPEQLFMYYACGEIFFSYLRRRKDVKKISKKSDLGFLPSSTSLTTQFQLVVLAALPF